MKLVIPVDPKRLFHPDPVPTQVAQSPARSPPADLSPEGGVICGVGRQDAREAGEERAVRCRRLGTEQERIVTEQSDVSIFKASNISNILKRKT